MTITVELPLETGELVAKAIDKARDDSMSSVEFTNENFRVGPRSRLSGATATRLLALGRSTGIRSRSRTAPTANPRAQLQERSLF